MLLASSGALGRAALVRGGPFPNAKPNSPLRLLRRLAFSSSSLALSEAFLSSAIRFSFTAPWNLDAAASCSRFASGEREDLSGR